jgi:hypothetical protein
VVTAANTTAIIPFLAFFIFLSVLFSSSVLELITGQKYGEQCRWTTCALATICVILSLEYTQIGKKGNIAHILVKLPHNSTVSI